MEWIPAISTSVVLGFVLWLGRGLITTRLTKSVQHEFDGKLESLRTELRNSEEVFRADLRAKEAEITVLRSGAMTSMASRQTAVDKRRLEAIEQIWSGFVALGPAKRIMIMLSGFNFDRVFAEVPHNKELRQVFKVAGAGLDENSIDFGTPLKARPFVSPMAWALYSAYQAIVMQAVAKLRLAELGVGNKQLIDTEDTKKLVKAALPYLDAYIDENGDSVYHLLLEILEVNLLVEFRKMMSGEEDDKETVDRAAKIVEAANLVKSSTLRGTVQSEVSS